MNDIDHRLGAYINHSCFSNPPEYWIEDDPFSRPVRAQDMGILREEWSTKIPRNQYRSDRALMAHRVLTNIYEQDLMFLPRGKLNLAKLRAFYAAELRQHGDIIRPHLEDQLFGFLSDEVEIGAGWTLSDLQRHCERAFDEVAASESSLFKVITSSRKPEEAAKFFLVQCASDFLSEASAMARNCVGTYGPYLSDLFKILIDEYGYGVHDTKHSQIFADLMSSLSLNPGVHYYWQFYTASSLSLVNYFHYLCKNHGLFFKYLGALYYTESTLALVTKHQARTLKAVFGDSVNTLYFDEHAHIDKHHGRMAFDNLIRPMVQQYGDDVIPDIVAGFEEFRLIQDMADQDLYQQISYNTDLSTWKAAGTEKWKLEKAHLPAGITLHEKQGEISVPHCHNEDELFVIEDGAMEFMANPFCPVVLSAGEAVIIPKYMHHGSRVLSPSCEYRVIPMGGI